MKKTGVIGLGDMGSGLANNLLKAGYETWGFDLSSERNKVFADMAAHADFIALYNLVKFPPSF